MLLGNGNGTFQAQQIFATGNIPISIALGDVNNDGRPDLAVANDGDNTVSVFLNTGNGNFTGQTFTIVSAVHFTVTAPGTAVAGSPIVIQVAALDASNNTVTGYIGTIHFTSSDTQAAFFPQDVTLTGGSGNFVVILKTGGTQTITATDSVTSTITGVSGSIAVSVGMASTFTITPVALPTFPSLPAAYPNNPNAPSTFATTGIPVVFSVMAVDAFGNAEPSYNGTVHFTSTDSAAVLPASATVTGGVGSFTATLMTPGSQTITAADINTPSITGGSGPIVTARPGGHSLFADTLRVRDLIRQGVQSEHSQHVQHGRIAG